MDLRMRKTLLAIQKFFVKQIRTVGFDRVTVQQIATDAMINRKTFYDHYHDKYDLRAAITQDFLDRYEALIQTRLEYSSKKIVGNAKLKQLVLDFFGDELLQQTCLALTGIRSLDYNFEAQVTAFITQDLAKKQIKSDPLLTEILTGTVFKTLSYYARTGETFSVERQLAVFQSLEAMFAAENN